MLKGFLLWIGILVFGVLAGDILGDIPVWVNLRSAFLVMVGTMIGGLLSAPLTTVGTFLRNLSASMRRKTVYPEALIRQITNMARFQRTLDIRELSTHYEAVENPFLRRGLLQILDNRGRDLVEDSMEKEISVYLTGLQSHLAVIQHFVKLAPVFGFVGTIIGLINVLNHMGDPSQIGFGMAISLLTTFYGLLMANFLFAPLASRLVAHIQSETLTLNIIIEGVLAIYDGQAPLDITHKLSSYIEIQAEADATDCPKRSALWPKWTGAAKQNGLAR